MKQLDPAYRSALIVSAILNLLMFAVEGGVGWWIGSTALIADAIDFFEDTGIYTLGVVALAWSARRRAWMGLGMGVAMYGVGFIAVGQVIVRLIEGGMPAPWPMAETAAAALAVNAYCAYRLAPHKHGDSSVRSIWLSTRNDTLVNALTMVTAGVVALTARAWPDLVAGMIIAGINLWGAWQIVAQARGELRRA